MNKIQKIILLVLLCSIPALLLIWKLLTDQLGANPVEYLEHATGDWAIYFLFLTLAVTPMQTRLKINWNKTYLAAHLMRRILGLAAFFYALLHLSTYFIFEMNLSVEESLLDIMERPFIAIGMLSFTLLLALAITSNAKAQRIMKTRWKTLHKSIYTLTFLGILHYALLVKADLLQPLLYLFIFAILMLFRLRPNSF